MAIVDVDGAIVDGAGEENRRGGGGRGDVKVADGTGAIHLGVVIVVVEIESHEGD